MALLKFLKGNYSSLSTKAIAEGQVLICGDTGEMFVDVAAGKRVKIGDFVVVPTLEALEALDATAVPTSRLYYVEDGNILARSNGSGWTQINKQQTLAQLGGVSSTTYATDKAALVKADGENATAISNLETLVGTLPEGATATTVVDYIDKKTAGIASDAALTELAGRVTTAEGEIDTLQAAIGKGGSVTNAIAEAKKAGTDAQAAVDTLESGKVKDNADAIAAINNESTGILAQAKTYADGKDTAISAAQTAAGNAQADVDALEAKVGTVANGKTVVGLIGTAQAAADAAQDGVNTLSGKIGTVAEGKTVVKMIEDAQTAATYDDTALKGRVKANEDAITVLNGDETKEGSVKKQVADAVAQIVANAPEAYDTLKEISDWISNHASDAATMNSNITTNKNDIAALEALVGTLPEGITATTVVGYIQEAITALKIGDYAKRADLDTHTGNTTVHITADERSKWNAAEGKAHTHGNKALLDTYTQTEADLADAVAKKHSHNNKTVLDGITAKKVSAWDNAQANAEATAASALASAKTELEGKITAAEGKVTALANGTVAANTAAIEAINGTGDGSIAKALSDAKAYTDTLANGQVTTNKNDIASLLEQITWGSF